MNETLEIERWITNFQLYTDEKYISDQYILFKKNKIITNSSLKDFINQTRKINEDLMSRIPYERGTLIKLPMVARLALFKAIYIDIDFDNLIIPFDYYYLNFAHEYLHIANIYILKASDKSYLLKFFDYNDEFVGALAGCEPIKKD